MIIPRKISGSRISLLSPHQPSSALLLFPCPAAAQMRAFWEASFPLSWRLAFQASAFHPCRACPPSFPLLQAFSLLPSAQLPAFQPSDVAFPERTFQHKQWPPPMIGIISSGSITAKRFVFSSSMPPVFRALDAYLDLFYLPFHVLLLFYNKKPAQPPVSATLK